MDMTVASELPAIVARAQAGDPAAFDAIYEQFSEPLYRYLYVRCGNATVAEDLSGAVWVRIVEHLPRFRFRSAPSEAAFAAWLYTIARNLLHDMNRRSGREHISLPDTIPSAAPSPDDQVLKKEAQDELSTALEQLTPEQREIILFRFMEEHSIDEVARLTRRSQGAVKALQHRALRTLGRALAVQRGQK